MDIPSSPSAPPLLTVILPIFNEARTVEAVLDRVDDLPLGKEIIIVDDGSSDDSAAIIGQWAALHGAAVICHAVNLGKGTAIRSALSRARGRFTIVQDGDLETFPEEYPLLLAPLLAGAADIVVGTRFPPGTKSRSLPSFVQRAGIGVLNLAVRSIYGQRLTDQACCYKVLETETLRRMNLQSRHFEFCCEVVAKACLMNMRFEEVPIRYSPRTVRDGKKIRLRDGWAALLTLWRCRTWQPPSIAAQPASPSGARGSSNADFYCTNRTGTVSGLFDGGSTSIVSDMESRPTAPGG